MDEEFLNIDAAIKPELSAYFTEQEVKNQINSEIDLGVDIIKQEEGVQNKFEFSDPLELAENIKIENTLDNDDASTTVSQNKFINELVLTVLNRIRNPFQTDVINSESELLKVGNGRKRKNIKSTDEQEARLLKQRMIQMKNRLLVQLELPEKAKAAKERTKLAIRLKRQIVRETETPEEAAERKKRHADQVRLSRKRLLELETPEQRVIRISKRNEKKKLRLQAKQAKETPEERAKRRERERMYREKRKQMPGKLAMNTGKIRVRKNKKLEKELEHKI